MKISKRVRNGYALALAFMLVLPCVARIQTQAALAIDVDKDDCSITISVEDSEYKDEFNELSIPVSLYKAADVNASGEYTAVGAFSEMQEEFNSIGSATTAEDWAMYAKEAEAYCKEAEPVGTVDVRKPEGGAQAAEGVFTGLKPGMYLVAPEKVYDADYTVQYQFTPYLTALPSSEYTLSGAGSDEWVYDTRIGLKADSEELLGSLDITKNLVSYNESLGQTSFVFKVEGYDSYGNLKYSNVASTTHGGTGSETVTLYKIPAGLNVTVTEIYSGASYGIAPGSSLTPPAVKIQSDIAVSGMDGDGNVVIEEALRRPRASVSFTNEYTGGNRGGYGVTNQFEWKESDWDWENPAPISEQGE